MILSTTIATTLKVTLLLVAGCTGTDINSDDVGDCPTSQYVESFTGPNSQSDCDQFIRTKAFEPENYMPGYPSYVISCRPDKGAAL
jgi:hypothetical protein